MPKFLLWLFLFVFVVPCVAKAKEGDRLPDVGIQQDVAALIALLRSPDPLDRVQALNALGDLKGKAEPAIPSIALLLGDQGGPVFDYWGSGNPTRVGERASLVLRSLGIPTIPALASALQNGSTEARANASVALMALSQTQADHGMYGLDLELWPLILTALQDDNSLVSHNAASILLGWHRRRYAVLDSLPTPLRGNVLVSLALPVEPFLKVSRDKRPFVRETILQFLPAIADGRGRDRIFEALKDPEASVQETAVGLIADNGANWLYDPRSFEPLLLALKSDYAHGNFVWSAIYSLRRYKDPRVNDALLFVLKTNKDNNAQTSAIEVLRELKELRTVEPLIEALKTQPSGFIGDLMASTLADLGDRRAIPVVGDYFVRSPGYVSGDAFEKLAGQDYWKYKAAQEAKAKAP